MPCGLLMDRAYEGNETRQLSVNLGYTPVVPPNPNRLEPWDYDRELYKRRNEVERLFRRIKAYRRIFTRYDKLDIVYLGFLLLAFIFEILR
jgi:transposase